jgi:hypothetical protein
MTAWSISPPLHIRSPILVAPASSPTYQVNGALRSSVRAWIDPASHRFR